MWQSEWEFWSNHPDLSALHVPDWIREALVGAAQRNLPPIADRLELLSQEGEIAPGVCAIAAPGHTPGHMALSIASQGEQLLYLVDTVLHPIHMEHPEWRAAVDLLPEQTVTTRRRLLARAVEEHSQVFVFHFPAPGLGRVAVNGEAWMWQPE